MPISGTQKAKMYARVNLMRLGASRLDYYRPDVKISIATIDRSSGHYVRVAGLSINDVLDGTPNTATLRVANFTPLQGQEIKIALGAYDTEHYLFVGQILTVKQIYEAEKPANVAYDLSCISHEWLLNRRQVTKRYTNQIASEIVRDLIANFAVGYTAVHVVTELPIIDEITFTNEDVSAALDRLARRVGGYWYIDNAKDVHFFLTEAGAIAGPIATGAARSASDIASTTDLSQVKTRVSFEGGGSSTLVPCLPGDTTMPLVDTSWYITGGGVVVSGPQRITYTGKSALAGTGTTAAGKPLSPSAPGTAVVSGTAGNLLAGDRTYKTSIVTSAGESEVSSASSTVTISGVTAPGTLTQTDLLTTSASNLVADGGVHKYKVTFVTAAGETLAGSATSGTNAGTVGTPGAPSVSGTTGGSLTTTAAYRYAVTYGTANGETTAGTVAPITLTGAQNAVSLTSIPTSGDGRVTNRRIYRNLGNAGDFASKFLVTTLNDNSTTTYTDTTADASLGSTVPPFGNTTGWQQMSLSSIPTSGDARVTKRRIYRTVPGGSVFKFLTTINDNSTTTYTDNTASESLGAEEPATDTSGSGQIDLTGLPIGPAGTTSRKIYRTEAGGTVYKFVDKVTGNVTTTYRDNVSDGSLGETAPTESHVGSSAGDTTLRVADTAVVASSGGWVQVGSQIIRFTGRSVSSGEGNLTGIPGGGTGSIAAGIAFGTAVINAPFLSGIPAGGVGSILYPIAAGDDVNLLVTVNDAAAQTAMASLTGGGDGVHEDYLQDRRLSATEATARATAQLKLTKDPLVTMTYTTFDQSTKSGRTVTFNLASPTNLTGTFKIQSVTITDLDPTARRFPRRQVQASSRRFTFESLLNFARTGA